MTRFSLLLALCFSQNAVANPSTLDSAGIDQVEYEATFSSMESQLSSDTSGTAIALMQIIQDDAQAHAHGAAYGLLADAFREYGSRLQRFCHVQQSFSIGHGHQYLSHSRCHHTSRTDFKAVHAGAIFLRSVR